MKVFLTGGSGFVGSHCLDLLLQNGHQVVTTVRSQKKGDDIMKAFPTAGEDLAYAIVPDIAAENAFHDAIKVARFDAVLHVASPFHYKPKDVEKDLIDPAVKGSMNILNAVHQHAPTVKRIVLTSSMSAVVNIKNPPPRYEEHDFNPVTMEDALSNGVDAYRASKTFAERAAWSFMKTETPTFDLATINPPLILGPPAPWLAALESVNTSNERLVGLVNGDWQSGLPPTASWYWVDVRDVALTHIRALDKPEAGGRRFLFTPGRMSNADIARIAINQYPHLKEKLPERLIDDTPSDLYDIDTMPSRTVLGMGYGDLDRCIRDSLKAIYSFNAGSV